MISFFYNSAAIKDELADFIKSSVIDGMTEFYQADSTAGDFGSDGDKEEPPKKEERQNQKNACAYPRGGLSSQDEPLRQHHGRTQHL